jgi:ATP-dependent Lon protease
MFERVIDFVKNSRLTQFTLTLLLGVAIGAVLYPTKHIEEKLKKTFEQETTVLKQQHAQELQQEQEKTNKVTSEYSQYKVTSEAKITSLTTQVTSLKLHQKKTFFKIVHPDGTVEERASSTTDSEEEQQVSQEIRQEYKQQLEQQVTRLEQIQIEKVVSLQKEWDSKEQDYKKQISTLEQSKIVDINPKNFTLDVGMLTNMDYYGHVSYNLFGPFVLGLQGQFGSSPAAGAGLGLKF